MRNLSIVDCGFETARDYAEPRWACKQVLRRQLDIPQGEFDCYLAELAAPDVLRKNTHAYIDTLVMLNNEVQRYCSYAKEYALIPEVEFMHSMNWTDQEIEKVAKSPAAILFCHAVKEPEAINPKIRLKDPTLCLV